MEKVYLTVEKVKLNVYESYMKGLKSVINRGLIRSLNVIESSDLGEQSNRNSPKCQGVCYKSSETFAFPNIQDFIHIILDFISNWDYNYTIETNTFCPQVSCQFFTLPPLISL